MASKKPERRQYRKILIPLDIEADADILKFLDEKDAKTFIVREALKLYIRTYKRIYEQELINKLEKHMQEEAETITKPKEPKNTEKALKFLKG